VKERIYRYLVEAGGEARVERIWRDCLCLVGDGVEAVREPILGYLARDGRFRLEGDLIALAPGHGDPGILLLDEAPFTVVDIETTGTSASGDAIAEIAAVRVRGGAMEESFATLVDPRRAIPPWITSLTGISDDMVRGRPTIAEALPEFLSFLGSDVLVAHNAPFDRGFLNEARERLQGLPLENPTLCTVRLARRYLPRLRRRDLDSVTRHLGIHVEGRHRALGDAVATAEVLLALLERAGSAGARTVGELLATCGSP
jgi:DNA polymerase-3 subunit epsilon